MFVRSTSTRRRTRLSAMAAAAVLTLTGCGALQPGVAATVGSATITHDEVDRVARALCSANTSGAAAQNQPAPELATAGARQAALQVLVESELSRMFGESEGVEPNDQEVSAAVAQNEAGIALLPESQRGDFRDALQQYTEGLLTLTEIGKESLAEQGQGGQVPDDAALSEGTRLRAEWASNVDVKLDPRYGSYSEGTIKPGDRALSVATSEDARAATAAEPPPGWVQSLPASQKCA